MGKTYQSVVVNAPAETVWAKWSGNDKSAAEFCHGIYAGLLEQLKKTLEQAG